MKISNEQIPTIGEDNGGLTEGIIGFAMLLPLQDVPFFTETPVSALSVFTLLVTNSPYLAVIKISAGAAVVDVDDVTWGTKTFSPEWGLVALVLTV